MCNHDVHIVRFYVFIHVRMRMCVFIPYFVECLKQCIVCVSEICRFLLKVYLFVFEFFLDKQV